MRARTWWLALFCLFAPALSSAADSSLLDCSKKSLADAVRRADGANPTISFTGLCAGPIAVAIDGLTLRGVGTAIIDGGGADAVTVTGSSRVTLIDLEVTNGADGIVARDGAHLALSGVNSHDNTGSGIVVQSASSAVLSGVSSVNNGGVGLMGDDAVSITVTGSTMVANTARDIQLTFGTRADVRTSVFGTYSCDATVLIRGTSGITCPH